MSRIATNPMALAIQQQLTGQVVQWQEQVTEQQYDGPAAEQNRSEGENHE